MENELNRLTMFQQQVFVNANVRSRRQQLFIPDDITACTRKRPRKSENTKE